MKTLLERIQDQFKKVGLIFIQKKETYTKYVGVLIDDKTKYELPHEISKCVQVHLVRQYADSVRNMMDMHIKIEKMKSGN